MPAVQSKPAKVHPLSEDAEQINKLAAHTSATGPTVVTALDPTRPPKVEQAAPLLSHWSEQGTAAAHGARSAAGHKDSGVQVLAHSGTKRNQDDPALGYLGPLGPYGPLGTLGPIGQNLWNPSQLISGSFDWSEQQKQLTAAGGPLSAAGPLGPKGPLAQDQKNVPAPLRVGGDEAVLGPQGPLGALGPLGPLGPIGAHGYKADADGNYRDKDGNIVRSVEVPSGDGKRSYDLVENYGKEQAAKMKDNDTSFMVHGAADRSGGADSFSFQAKSAQNVTVLLVPEHQLDSFGLTIRDAAGKVLYDSKSMSAVAWAQLRVPAGTQLSAQIKLGDSSQFLLPPSYRLIVTGADQ